MAVYFRIGNDPYVVASDRYNKLAANLRSVAITLNALRTIGRYHSGILLRTMLAPLAYKSHSARPEPVLVAPPPTKVRPTPVVVRKDPLPKLPSSPPSWKQTLELTRIRTPTWAMVREQYRKLAIRLDPDNGGNREQYQKVVEAYEEARRFFKVAF